MDARIEAGFAPEEAVALARAAGWEWTLPHASLVRAMQPEGAFSARAADGGLLGTVSCVLWGDLAWIGSMLVDERARRQGIGTALLRRALAFADERGARVVGLDATERGRPLYEREGFGACGESARWRREGQAQGQAQAQGDFAIYPVSPAEIMELLACDTPRFGAGRGRYLAALMGERPHQSFVAIDRKTGAFRGHALSHDGRIGPIVADTPAMAAALLRAIELAGATPRAIVPAWNPAAERVFADAGYVRDGRGCTRMARGGPLPGRPETCYAVGAWALG